MGVDLPPRYALHPTDPVLGEGGMGKVYRARDTVLDVPVALKVVRPELAADPRFAKLFAMEVRIAARFTHEHIVPLHDLGLLGDGTPFLGLALADSGNFGKLKESADWAEILRLTFELLEALGHLHARGVLHRDLKPDNVLLHKGSDGKPHVWLADLGLAKAATDLARKKGRTEGTPGYMSPEQSLSLVREYGPWTDLFSVGVILWKLVTGKLPFGQDRSPLDSALPPLVPRQALEVPAGLEVVLGNLLAAEPLSRYDVASDLATELAALGPPAFGYDDAMKAVRDGWTGQKGGTVAPSAPRPTPPHSSLSDDVPSGADVQMATSTWFGAEIAGDQPPKAPLWNRPLPPPLPPTPPPDPGTGGTARASLPLLALRDLPLVARDSFRRLLWDEARRVAVEKRPRVVLVVGEAGSGKSHLVDSVVRALHAGGWAESVTLGWQAPAGAEDGYPGAVRALVRPWNETRRSLQARLVRWLSRDYGVLDDGVLVEASLLARWCGLLEEGEEAVPGGLGLRALLRWLEARAWRGLAVAVLDDVGRAVEDGDGLSIAEAVLATADDAPRPLLVIATLRSEDLANPDTAEEVKALEAAGARRVDLPRLDRAGTQALLAETLTLTPDLSAKVVARCEGNPLFARQLLLEWAQRGWLVDAGGLRFGLAPDVDADAAMPADAEALFVQRVEAIVAAQPQPEPFRDVLHLVALAGQSVPRGLIETLAGDLAPAVRASTLFVEQGDQLRFDHGLLHQALRAKALARPDAPMMHGRLATTWAKWAKDTGGDHDLGIGRHAHAAAQWVVAADHLLRAAQSAWRRGRTKDLGEAARLASDACNRDKKVKWRAGEAKLWQARLAQIEGEGQVAAERFFEAHQIFADLEDPDGVGHSLVGMGWAALRMGKIERAERRYKEALDLAQSREDAKAEIRALQGLAWLEQQKRNFDGADILFTRAVARAEDIDDARGVASALLGQAFVARRTGRLAEALEIYKEAEEAAKKTNDLLAGARARLGEGIARWQRKEHVQADALLREARGIAEDIGSTELLGQCGVALADVMRSRGEVDRARQIYTLFLRQAQRRHAFEEVVLARLGLAHLALLSKDLAGAHAQVKQAQRFLETVPGHWLWATWKLFGAVVFAMQGDAEKAREWVWSAQDLGLDDTVDQDTAFLLTVICNRAKQEKWEAVVRVAAPLAVSQWERLGRPRERERIERVQAEVLGSAAPAPPRR